MRPCRPIQTRFRYGSGCHSLNLSHTDELAGSFSKRHAVRQAGAHPYGRTARQRPPTDCKHTVSGSFDSASSRTFHLSLTVLVHYRSSNVFSLGKWASLLPAGLACPAVLRLTGGSQVTFVYRTITFYGRAFQTLSTSNLICNSHMPGPTTPFGKPNGLG